MTPVTNGRLLYNQTPTGYPEPGKTTVYDNTETIDLETTPLNGGFLVKMLDLSVDPYMRDRMHDGTGHTPPYTKGKPIDGLGVGVVLRSESANVKTGDHVYGFFPYQEYWVASSQVLNQTLWILENKEKLPWSVYLGAAGMPGQTAYASWKEFANAKKGEVVFVSTGAGAVGSFVIQLAKADGLKVIASAGTDEKVAFMKSLGADVAFNYKTTSYVEVLAKDGPVDIYFDNVGGEALDAAFLHSAHNARFLECGMISTLNAEAPPVKNLLHIIAKEIRVYGFVLTSLFPKYLQAFMSEVPARIASGEIKYVEDVTVGLENAGQAIRDVQTGQNKGKSIVRVARE